MIAVVAVANPRVQGLVDRWRWILLPAAIAVSSRLLSIALVLWQADAARPPFYARASPLSAWDGQWYLEIAHHGYHAAGMGPNGNHDFAFPPGWPLLIRIASLNGLLKMDLTAVVLSNLLFVIAALTIYRLFAARFSERVALLGTLLLCFNPAGYVFSMAYSEALFVLLASLYFVVSYGKTSPVFAALATLVRVSGLAIGASAAMMLVMRRQPRSRTLLICGAIAAAFALWWIYIWQLTGSFTGWFEGSPVWDAQRGVASITTVFAQHRSWVIAWMLFVGVMLAGSTLLLKRHTDLAIYGLAIAAISLAGTAWSMPRYAMVAFPAFAGLADRLGTRLSLVLLAVFVVGEYVFVSIAFGARPVPP